MTGINLEENQISIRETKHDTRRIATINPFFKESIVINIETTKVIFSKPMLDYTGKIVKFSPYSTHPTYICHINSNRLEKGVYVIDEEESNEDQVVIYFEDKIETL